MIEPRAWLRSNLRIKLMILIVKKYCAYILY